MTLFDSRGRKLEPMVRNPFLDYPKKLLCWCGSKHKAGVCCLPKMAKMIPEREAGIGRDYMKYVKEQLAKRDGWRPERAKRELKRLGN